MKINTKCASVDVLQYLLGRSTSDSVRRLCPFIENSKFC